MIIGIITYVSPEPVKLIADDDFVATYPVSAIIGDRRSVEAFGKFFRKPVTQHAAFGEVIGSQFGSRIGAKCAEAYLSFCPKDLVPLNSDWGIPHDSGVLCVASITVPGIPLAHNNADANIPELLRSKKLLEAIILDELFYHSGRNSENYFIVALRELWLIDHEKILSGSAWDIEKLQAISSLPTPGNHLARTFFEANDEVGRKRLFNRAAEVAADILNHDDWHKIVYEAAQAVGMDVNEAQVVINTLSARAQQLVKFLMWQMKLAEHETGPQFFTG